MSAGSVSGCMRQTFQVLIILFLLPASSAGQSWRLTGGGGRDKILTLKESKTESPEKSLGGAATLQIARERQHGEFGLAVSALQLRFDHEPDDVYEHLMWQTQVDRYGFASTGLAAVVFANALPRTAHSTVFLGVHAGFMVTMPQKTTERSVHTGYRVRRERSLGYASAVAPTFGLQAGGRYRVADRIELGAQLRVSIAGPFHLKAADGVTRKETFLLPAGMLTLGYRL